MLLSEPDVPMQQLVHTLEVMTDAGPRDGKQSERRFLLVTWMSWYDERIADCMSAVE